MERIAIIGSPRAGKTTLAARLSAELRLPVYCSDDHIALGWSPASDAVAQLLALRNPGIYEGIAVVRSLRKLLAAVRDEPPVDRCIVLTRPWVQLTAGQEVLRKGCATILRGMELELLSRGVEVVFDPEEP